MKPASYGQMKANDAFLEAEEATGKKRPDMPLKFKYTIHVKAKFGGKKKSSSNSGGAGRAGRRKARPHKPSVAR